MIVDPSTVSGRAPSSVGFTRSQQFTVRVPTGGSLPKFTVRVPPGTAGLGGPVGPVGSGVIERRVNVVDDPVGAASKRLVAIGSPTHLARRLLLAAQGK